MELAEFVQQRSEHPTSHYHLVNLNGTSEYNSQCYQKEGGGMKLHHTSDYLFNFSQSIFGGLSYTTIAIAGLILNLVVMIAFWRDKGIRNEYLGRTILSLVTSDFLYSIFSTGGNAVVYFFRYVGSKLIRLPL